jgi:hypothetical protein
MPSGLAAIVHQRPQASPPIPIAGATMSTTDLVRRYYDAWPAHKRATVEQLTAEEFHFTSPLDSHLDRATFLERELSPS